MKFSIFLLCLVFSAMVASKSDTGRGGRGTEDDIPEEYAAGQEEEEEVDELNEDYDVEPDGEALDAAPVAVAQQATEPFRYKPSQRLEETSDAMPTDKKRLIAGGQVKQEITDAVTAAMSTKTAAQGLADVKHEWRLMVAGPEAARVIGTAGGNVKRLLTSPAGSEFVSTALATAHVLLSKAGDESRGSGLGRVLSAAFYLFSSPTMPEVVNKAGGLLLTAVTKPNAALFVRRFWDEVSVSLGDRKLADKLNKCGKNLVSLMKTVHQSDSVQQTPAGSRRSRK